MSKTHKDIELEQARLIQMEAVQMLLFSMSITGEPMAGYQLEIDGVLQSLIVRKVSQAEFFNIMEEAARDARARARATGRPLT